MTCAMRMAQPCHNGGTSVPCSGTVMPSAWHWLYLRNWLSPARDGYRLISVRLTEAARSHRSWWNIPPRKDAPPLPVDCFAPHAIRYQTTRRVYSGRWRSGSSLGRLRGSLSLGSIGRGCFYRPSRSCSCPHAGQVPVLGCAIGWFSIWMRALRCSRFRLKPSKRLIPMVTP